VGKNPDERGFAAAALRLIVPFQKAETSALADPLNLPSAAHPPGMALTTQRPWMGGFYRQTLLSTSKAILEEALLL